MFEQVTQDIKTAMKSKDKARLEVLRMIKSKLIENKTAPSPQGEQDVIIKYAKQLKDSLTQFPDDSPQFQQVQQELGYLKTYLPDELTEDAVKSLIQGILQENPEANFGAIMKALSPQIKGRFDGKRASQLAKELTAN